MRIAKPIYEVRFQKERRGRDANISRKRGDLCVVGNRQAELLDVDFAKAAKHRRKIVTIAVLAAFAFLAKVLNLLIG